MSIYEQILAGALGTAFAGLIAYVALTVRDWLFLSVGIIRIVLDDGATLPANSRLMFRHVRDGKDEVAEKGPLQNRDVPFTFSQNKWFIKTHYKKGLGFQFKCFFDTNKEDEASVKQWLEEGGFLDIFTDEMKSGRIWFVLPEIPTCRAVDGYTNNFFHPNINEVRFAVK